MHFKSCLPDKQESLNHIELQQHAVNSKPKLRLKNVPSEPLVLSLSKHSYLLQAVINWSANLLFSTQNVKFILSVKCVRYFLFKRPLKWFQSAAWDHYVRSKLVESKLGIRNWLCRTAFHLKSEHEQVLIPNRVASVLECVSDWAAEPKNKNKNRHEWISFKVSAVTWPQRLPIELQKHCKFFWKEKIIQMWLTDKDEEELKL